MKYHNSPNGPRICRANIKQCPYGLAGQPHYDNIADAREAYEKTMYETFGGIEGVKHSKGLNARLEAYHHIDRAEVKIKAVLASPAAQKTVSVLKAIRNLPGRARSKARKVRSVSSFLGTSTMQKLHSYNNGVKSKVEFSKKLASERAKDSFKAVKSIADKVRAQKAPVIYKEKTQPISKISYGDRINGMNVASVYSDGRRVTVRTDGGFVMAFRPNDNITYSKPKTSLRTKIKESNLYRGMKEASQQQKAVFKTLSQTVHPSSRRIQPEYYKPRELSNEAWAKSSPSMRDSQQIVFSSALPKPGVIPPRVRRSYGKMPPRIKTH
jgi:hypothetical protein